MKKVQNFCLFFGALILLCSPILAEEKQLPAIHFSSTEEQKKEEVQPAPEPQQEYEQPVETVAFNGITPSKTTVEELHKMLGEPAKVQKDGMGEGIDVEEYKIEGFKGVDFHIMKGLVYGVIAELPESVDARKLAADLRMEHIQSVFIMDEKGVIKGEVFPEIGVAYAYDPSKKLGTIEEMQKDPKSVPMNVIQLIFQPVGPEPFLLRAETWVDIDQKRAYKDILQALKLDPNNKQALAYKKTMDEAIPTLKDEIKLKDDESKNDGSKSTEPKEDEGILETLTPPPLESISEDVGGSKKSEKSSTEDSKAEEPKHEDIKLEDASDINELDPPDLDTLTEETGKDKPEKVEKTEKTDENELPLTLDLEVIQDSPKEETKDEPKEEVKLSVEKNTNLQEDKVGGKDSLRPAEEEDGDSTLDLPQELSDDLAKLNEPDMEKSMLPSKEQPILSFEDDLFQKVENLAQNGKFEEALDLLKEIRKRFIDNPFISFRANLVEGDILMIMPASNREEAFSCHRMAAEQGEKLLEGKAYRGRKYPLTKEEKRRVKLLLLDVYLGAAGDLSVGSSEEKKNCEKWLDKAAGMLKELVPEKVDDYLWEDAFLCYKISYRSLSILLKSGKDQEIDAEVNRHLTVTMKMLSLAKNSTEYFNICMKTSLLLDDASTMMILKEHYGIAEDYLDRAIKFMEQVKSHRKKVVVQEELLLAQLYYHRGQVVVLKAAKRPEDEVIQAHEEAVEWYEKALPVLLEVIKTKQWKDLLQLGKIMNGMSVSYAKLGNAKKAVILLKTSIFCLEKQAENNPEDEGQLQIPYKNIIRLLKYLDQKDEAEEYQRKMEARNL